MVFCRSRIIPEHLHIVLEGVVMIYQRDDFVLYLLNGNSNSDEVKLGRFVEYTSDEMIMARVMSEDGVILPYLLPVSWLKGKLISGSLTTHWFGKRFHEGDTVLVRCLPIDFYYSFGKNGKNGRMAPYIPSGRIVAECGPQRFVVALKREGRKICQAFQLEHGENGKRKEVTQNALRAIREFKDMIP